MDFEKGMKIRKEVILIDVVTYYTESKYYYDDGARHIYKFLDDEGNLFVWRTSKIAGVDFVNAKDEEGFEFINIGDKLFIAASIKGLSTYKWEEQILITRCQIKEIIEHSVMTEDEVIELRKNMQLKYFNDSCSIRTVSYRDYKNEYSKCETVIGSFNRSNAGCFIDVIVPETSSIYYYQ